MKEDFLEDIKKAISSTTRAIAEDKEIDVVFEDNLSHSASVGDIIILDKEEGNKSVYVIDNIGFTKIN